MTKMDPSDNNNDESSSSFSWMKNWFTNFHDEQRLERLQHCRQLETILRNCRNHHHHHPNNNNNNNNNNNTSNYDPDSIEQVSIGLRMMKYFGWRGILTITDSNTTDDESSSSPSLSFQNKKIIKSCAREQHAVWACRAVAIGCGKELSALKTCFDQDPSQPTQLQHPRDHEMDKSSLVSSTKPSNYNNNLAALHVLKQNQTNYETKSSSPSSSSSVSSPNEKTMTRTKTIKIPCADLQQSLGTCVTLGAQELYQRRQQQNQKQQNPRDSSN